MCHWLRAEGKFWKALVRTDEQVAEKVREKGCQHCGGRLHRADYPRKPRGELGEAEGAFCRRHRFCCSQCRRRATPPSVRFLGRKVYVGQLVVAACLCWQAAMGAVGKRVGLSIGIPKGFRAHRRGRGREHRLAYRRWAGRPPSGQALMDGWYFPF